MKKEDSRVRYTRQIIRKTLLEFMKEKPVSRITVSEICRKAEINRGTFYLHYNTPSDVLHEIEDDFVNENTSSFLTYVKARQNWSDMTDVFSRILKDREILLILMGPNGSGTFQTRIQETVRPLILRDWKSQYPGYAEEDLAFVYDYAASGAVNVLMKWMEHPENISPENFARRMDRLGYYCIRTVGEFHPEKQKF